MKVKGLCRILVYGDIDMNLLDGSSIWLNSLIQVLARSPSNEVHLLLKSPVRRDLLLQDLRRLPNVRLAESFGRFSLRSRRGLTPERALRTIKHMRAAQPFDWIVLRGNDLCIKAVEELDKPQQIIPYFATTRGMISHEDKRALEQVHDKVRVIFLQTKELKGIFLDAVGATPDKIAVLPPMVPDFSEQEPGFRNINNALVYVGKFSRDYLIYESLRAFEKLGQAGYRFNIAGDKFHREPGVSKRRLVRMMNETPGVHWKKALPRDEVSRLIERSDLGLCWRSRVIDNEQSAELSTKLLEYGRLGKPVLLRRIPIHERLLGDDYPFYVDSEADLMEKVRLAFEDEQAYEKGARKTYSASRAHSFGNVSRRIQPILDQLGAADGATRNA